MPRTKGSKNKNINTAKNKNIININVNSSKSKKGRGRPKKQSNDTTQYRQAGGMGGMAPPQVIISQPQPTQQQDNSLLSSFITSKLLNESNISNSRTTMPSFLEQPTTREQPSYFNARESIIPRLPDTPLKQEVQPPTGKGPPPPPKPPPPPPPKPPAPNGLDLTGLSGRDAMLAELKYAQTDEGKAEKARKKAEAAAKREAKKIEKEIAPNPDNAATKLQKVMRGRITRNKISNEIGQIESQIAGIEKKVQKAKNIKENPLKFIKENPIKTIQAIYRGNKIRNKLANDKSFQNKIDMKIKKYGDAASEYKTRGADDPDVNKEFSDVIKTMRTGLQKYKTTLGTQPKKRGPKPKSKYLSVNELEV